VKIKIKKLHDDVKIPEYAHPGDAGMDVYSRELRTLEQGEPHLFKLGFSVEIPEGHVAMICDRSSMGKKGVRVLGGIIDAHYRGEWGVILINLTKKEIKIEPGDKIAQALLLPVVSGTVEETQDLSETQRGAGGFGSTGK
jgi:dUTP pyrophosphatase